MKVEFSDSGKAPQKKKRKRRIKIKGIIIAFLTLLTVIAVAVALMLTVFFNANAIKVTGSSIYTENEILIASGIMEGDNILRMPKEDIEARIEQALPYVKKAEVLKSLPETVGIKVAPAEESMVLETEGVIYVLDKDYKVLRVANEVPQGMLRIKGIKSSGITVGTNLIFSDKQQNRALADLMAIGSDEGLNIGYVDISSLVDIKFAVDNRLFIKLGSYNYIDGKINHLEAMLKSIDKSASASISLEDWAPDNKKAVLKYENINDLIK